MSGPNLRWPSGTFYPQRVMSFFKPINLAARPTRTAELDFLEPLAASALGEKASLWRALEMLRAVSVSLMFVSKRLVFVRHGWGRDAAVLPRSKASTGKLIWHLLGEPSSARKHDLSLRQLAVDLAWYQVSRYLPHTPPEIKEIVHFYGPQVSPHLLHDMVMHDFNGISRNEDFFMMLRQFKVTVMAPEDFSGWETSN